jgi:hypothetical protein
VDDSRDPSPEPKLDYTQASAALEACFRGQVGLAIYDPKDLHFTRFVPVVLSDGKDEQSIDAIALLGDTAFVSIGYRFPDERSVRLVAVDLISAKVKAQSTRALRPRIMSSKLFGCDEQKRSCTELDSASLEAKPDGPSFQLPGESATLTDHLVVNGPPIPGSPYLFDFRRGVSLEDKDLVLEARDALTGEFVCAWSGLAPRAGWPELVFVPYKNALVVAATVTSASDVRPSTILDVPTLVTHARACRPETKRRRAALERAIQALARVTARQ